MIFGGLELFAAKALLPWLLGAGAAATVAAVIVVAYLYWDNIVGWFRNNHDLVLSNPNNVAVMVRQAEASGKIGVVTGIFNRQTEQVLTAQPYRANQLDAQTQRMFGKNDVCIVT